MSKDLKGLSTTKRSCAPLSGRARTCPASILSNIKQYLCQMGLVICYGLRVARCELRVTDCPAFSGISASPQRA